MLAYELGLNSRINMEDLIKGSTFFISGLPYLYLGSAVNASAVPVSNVHSGVAWLDDRTQTFYGATTFNLPVSGTAALTPGQFVVLGQVTPIIESVSGLDARTQVMQTQIQEMSIGSVDFSARASISGLDARTQSMQSFEQSLASSLSGLGVADKVINTSSFNYILSGSDTTVQRAFDALDNHQHSTGCLVAPSIFDNGNLTFDVGSTDVVLYQSPNWTNPIRAYTVPVTSGLSITADSSAYLIASYNSGLPRYSVTTNPADINSSDTVLVASLTTVGSAIHKISTNWAKATSTRLINRLINTSRFEQSSGLVLSEDTGRVITCSAGVVWYGINNFTLSASRSDTATTRFWYRVSSVWASSLVTTYNNSQYDDGSNLQTLSNNNKFTVNWVYRCVGSPNELAYVLGSQYDDLTDAQNSQPPAVPSLLTRHMLLLGRIIVQKNHSTAAQIDSAFVTSYETMPVKRHNDLDGIQGGAALEYYHLTAAEFGSFSGLTIRLDDAIESISGLSTTQTALQSANTSLAANYSGLDTRTRAIQVVDQVQTNSISGLDIRAQAIQAVDLAQTSSLSGLQVTATSNQARLTSIEGFTFASVIHVAKNGSDIRGLLSPYAGLYPFLTVQAAVDAASSGDLIWIHPGTYEGTILLKSGVNFYGDPGVVLTHAPVGVEFLVYDNGVSCTNRFFGDIIFEIIGSPSSTNGCAVFRLAGSSNVEVSCRKLRYSGEDKIVTALSVGTGVCDFTGDIENFTYSALSIGAGTLNIRNAVITGGSGDQLLVLAGGVVAFTDCSITSTGGLWYSYGGKITLTDCTISAGVGVVSASNGQPITFKDCMCTVRANSYLVDFEQSTGSTLILQNTTVSQSGAVTHAINCNSPGSCSVSTIRSQGTRLDVGGTGTINLLSRDYLVNTKL